jgi:A/G-specific adenine glycosylase
MRVALDATPHADHTMQEDFRTLLLAWNAGHRRDCPWRAKATPPWLVLAAEVGLSRTRAEVVPVIYERLSTLAPSPRELLARLHPDVELKAIGLGMRAEIICEIARVLDERFDGQVPDTEHELRSLPGVGDGIAQAVRTFAFGRRAVLLDATTSRLVERYLGRSDTRRWQVRLDLYRLAGSAGPDAPFNRALLDHGSLVCRAEMPRCDECPLSRRCAARGGLPEQFQLRMPPEVAVDAA